MGNQMSETAKYRELTGKYCYKRNGEPAIVLDVASQGDPVAPWAWSLDLPRDEFEWYNSKQPASGPIQLRCSATHLPIDDNSVDTLYSSHLLEDFEDWHPILREWVRVIRPGGFLVILVPDKELWNAAVAKGQPPNCQHRHESHVGELTAYAKDIGVRPIEDRLTNLYPGDYTILFAGTKIDAT